MDGNVSRWSPIIPIRPIFSDPQSASGFSLYQKPPSQDGQECRQECPSYMARLAFSLHLPRLVEEAGVDDFSWPLGAWGCSQVDDRPVG
jgi:hypothetical protein